MADKKKRGASGPSKNAVEAKKADAAAKSAEAAGKQAEADAKKSADQLELKRLELGEKRRESDKSVGEQVRQGVLNVGAPAGGAVIGYKLSKMIERRQSVTVGLRNENLAKLAVEARKVVANGSKATRGAKLQAIVNAADQLHLGKVKGPLGLAPAALLLIEGGAARFWLAPTVQNETAKEGLTAVGTASAFAATTLVGERVLQNATPSALPAARDLAAIETARNIVGPAAAAPQTAMQIGKAALKSAAKKALLPLAVGAGVFAASMKAAKAGESKEVVAKEGGKAGLDILSGGAVTEFEKAKGEGLSDSLAATRGAIMGLANTITLGAVGIVDDAVMSKESVGYDPAAGAAKFHAAAAAQRKGKAYLNTGAETKAAQIPVAVMPAKSQAVSLPGSDGQTKAYARVNSNGLVVNVKGYTTPKR